jgi:hypothetical protein
MTTRTYYSIHDRDGIQIAATEDARTAAAYASRTDCRVTARCTTDS